MISDTNEKTEPAPLNQREMAQFLYAVATMPTLERALERLRWLEAEVVSLTAQRDEAFKSAINAALRADRHNADPLAEMWRELAEYQPQADADGHGKSWAKMCEERTANAAWDAYHSAPSGTSSSGLWSSRAAADAARAANFGNHAKDALAQIRRAKEGQS